MKYPTWVRPAANKTLIQVYIQPGASKSELSGVHGERLKIRIKQVPRDGEANDAVIEFVAGILKIAKSKVSFVRGESSRQKDLLIDISPEDALILIEQQLG